jgi:hypothetical protein
MNFPISSAYLVSFIFCQGLSLVLVYLDAATLESHQNTCQHQYKKTQSIEAFDYTLMISIPWFGSPQEKTQS